MVGRKAPYMHKDGSDCYTKNCSIDHAHSIEEQNKALYEDFTRKIEALKAEYEPKFAEAGEDLPKINLFAETTALPVSFCGDYPAPCNCDNPSTHDGATVNWASPVSANDPKVQSGEIFNEIEAEDGTIFRRRRDGVYPGEFQEIRIQANQVLTDQDANRLAGLIGFNWKKNIAGESLPYPTQDSPYSIILFADITKSSSDDTGIAMERFEDDMRTYVQEGSDVRKTNRSGPGTQGTRLVEGFGDEFEVEFYYDSVES